MTDTSSFTDPRLTEQRNPRTERIDVASSLEIVDLLHAEDSQVPQAVHAVRESIAQAIDLVVAAFQGGGRLVYVGAGTSGRLGVLDAAAKSSGWSSPLSGLRSITRPSGPQTQEPGPWACCTR